MSENETKPDVPQDKPTDPADKINSGVDQFQNVNRRAGYGDRYTLVYRWAKKGATLQAGEGKILADRIDSLEVEVQALTEKILQLTGTPTATPEQ